LIFDGLRQGLGIHHAGMLAPLKRFNRGPLRARAVQVVFATETMSLGIHMPAKASSAKPAKALPTHGFRTLRVGELTQMAGRAGGGGSTRKVCALFVVEGREALNEALGG